MMLARLAALLVLLSPAAALAKPPVWVVRDADSTIVLFGSVHALDRNRDWKPQALVQALAKADDLWFEIPMDEASQLAASQAFMAKAMLPPGERLSALLAPADRERLARLARTYRLPLAQLDRLQPWMADVTLANAFISAQGALAADGVERTLQAEVPPSVARRAFETAEQQLAMLSGASRKAQLASLRDTLREMDNKPDTFRRLLDLWMKGDVRQLEREVVQPLKTASPDMYETLIRRRNQAWVGQILTRLAGSGETVMVVGAGHLVGRDGVPALLRARGLKVEGP